LGIAELLDEFGVDPYAATSARKSYQPCMGDVPSTLQPDEIAVRMRENFDYPSNHHALCCHRAKP